MELISEKKTIDDVKVDFDDALGHFVTSNTMPPPILNGYVIAQMHEINPNMSPPTWHDYHIPQMNEITSNMWNALQMPQMNGTFVPVTGGYNTYNIPVVFNNMSNQINPYMSFNTSLNTSLGSNGLKINNIENNSNKLYSQNIMDYNLNIKKLEKNKTHEDIEDCLLNTNFVPNENDLYICGVSSKQDLVRQGLPRKYICLKNDYIEYRLFDIVSFGDAITNIKFFIHNPFNTSVELNAEIVLKINGYIICSKLCKSENKIKLIDSPNFIVLFSDLTTISVYMRIKSTFVSNIYLKYCLSYDPLYFSSGSRASILKTKNYNFKTSSGVVINAMSGIYDVNSYENLYDSIDEEFKSLYNSEETNDNYNNKNKKDKKDVDKIINKEITVVI